MLATTSYLELLGAGGLIVAIFVAWALARTLRGRRARASTAAAATLVMSTVEMPPSRRLARGSVGFASVDAAPEVGYARTMLRPSHARRPAF